MRNVILYEVTSSNDFLVALLARYALNVETLDLDHSQFYYDANDGFFDSDYLNKQNIQWPFLREFVAYESNIHGKTAKALLEKSPRLLKCDFREEQEGDNYFFKKREKKVEADLFEIQNIDIKSLKLSLGCVESASNLVQFFNHLHQLNELALEYCQALKSVDGWTGINLSNLRELSIAGHISPHCLCEILKSAPNLVSLTLDIAMDDVNDLALFDQFQGLQHLKMLILNNNYMSSDADNDDYVDCIYKCLIAKKYPQLQTLKLCALSDEDVKYEIEESKDQHQLIELESGEIKSANSIDVLKHVIKKNPTLLSFSTSLISLKAFYKLQTPEIVRFIGGLTHLTFSREMSDKVIRAWFSKKTNYNLVSLKIEEAGKLSSRTLDLIYSVCPRLKKFELKGFKTSRKKGMPYHKKYPKVNLVESNTQLKEEMEGDDDLMSIPRPGQNIPSNAVPTYFPGVHPRNYICSSSTKLLIDANTIKSVPVPVDRCVWVNGDFAQNAQKYFDENFKNKSNCFIGKFECDLSGDSIHYLPALSFEDKIIPIDGKTLCISSSVPVNLGYNYDARQYFIQLKNELIGEHHSVVINYGINTSGHHKNGDAFDYWGISEKYYTPDNTKKNPITGLDVSLLTYMDLSSDGAAPFEAKEVTKTELEFHFDNTGKLYYKPFKLKELIAFFRSFAKLDPKKYSAPKERGHALFNYMFLHRTGSCEHRARAFQAIMEQVDPSLEVRRFQNDCHEGVRILCHYRYFDIDLGGYSCELVPVEIPDIVHTSEFKSIRKKEKEHSQFRKKATLKTAKPPKSPISQLFTEEKKALPEEKKEPANPFHELIGLGQTLPRGSRNILISGCNQEAILKINAGLLREKKVHYHAIPNLADVSKSACKIHDNGQFSLDDSELVNYLKETKSNGVLVVDWNSYRPSLVGYNALMDNPRRLDGNVLIPEDMIVINVISDEIEALMLEDFFSRNSCEVEASQLTTQSTDIYNSRYVKTTENKNPTWPIIDLTGEDNWRDKLEGRLGADAKGKLCAKPGEIVTQSQVSGKEEKLTDTRGITLINPPDTYEFKLFLSNILNTDTVQFNNQSYKVPENFVIQGINQPYDFSGRYSIEKLTDKVSQAWTYSLNSFTYSQFFRLQHFTEQKLSEPVGWLGASKDKTLTVLVTETLAKDKWARLLSEARLHNVRLKFIFANNVNAPDEMLRLATPPEEVKRESKMSPRKLRVAITENPAAVIDDLYKQTKPQHVISVNKDMKFNDVIFQVQNSQADSKTSLSFKVMPGTVLKALIAGERVLLKGSLSTELKAQLETLFAAKPYLNVNGENVEIKGELVIVTKEHTIFECFKPAKGWQVLKPSEVKNEEIKVPPVTSYQNRARDVKEVFAHSPFVFIQGTTGAGKSTWVYDKLPNEYGKPVKLFSEMSSLEAWAFDKTPDTEKILFIDEANLESEGSFERFEDLFNRWTDKGILINGEYVKLSPTHKVIFAGNFKNYVGRKDHDFFKRHGAFLTFEALPEDVLKTDTIDPLLNRYFPEMKAPERALVSDIFLKCYNLKRTDEKLAITPRNLKMMVHYFKLFAEYGNEMKMSDAVSLENLAKFAAYQELSCLCNAADLTLLSQALFNQSTLPISLKCLLPIPYFASERFVFTESRLPVIQSLQVVLDARKRGLHSDKNGFLIEGPSGIGKSTMVVELLNKLTVPHVILTAAQPQEMEEKLTRAFHEGLVVVIDEINTLCIEKLLNRLMMGIDMKGEKARKPGFFVIGTQNPASFSGRQILSPAFVNRFTVKEAGDYPRAELKNIITAKGFSDVEADKLLDGYYHERTTLRGRKRPTPRDLFRHIESIKPVAALMREVVVPMKLGSDEASGKRKAEESKGVVERPKKMARIR